MTITKYIQKIPFLILLTIVISGLTLKAQPINSPVEMTIEFIENNKQLKYPLAGGLNNPLISEIDLNADNQMDLYIYDAQTQKHLTFLNKTIESDGEIVNEYQYTPKYENNFPICGKWVLLKDFNGDGIHDIFTHEYQYNTSGVKVYQGYYSESNEVNFELVTYENETELLYFTNMEQLPEWLYISELELPSIDDLDNDGDLDILTYGLSGGFATFYKNYSVEWGLGLDTLAYLEEELCWGGFLETGDDSVILSLEIGECATMGKPNNDKNNIDEIVKRMHGGSTFLSIDIENDGDKDLLLGDISRTNINLLQNGEIDENGENGGTDGIAHIDFQDVNFPSDDTPIDMSFLPATFYQDVDFDGLKDLLATPFAVLTENVENRDVIWYYKNTGEIQEANQFQKFEWQQNDFLVGDMIDVGSGSQPVFVDYNGDGLLDLVIGNYGMYDPVKIKDARLFLYLNIGTAENPIFELIDDDWLGLSEYSPNQWFYAPCFGDLDQDGDQDIIIGSGTGKLFAAYNTAEPLQTGQTGQTMSFDQLEFNFMDIDIGQNAAPALYDINEDGLLDLFIGNRAGTIQYFENTGTATIPFFESDATNEFWGEIDIRELNEIKGNSAPFFFEIDGNPEIIIGSNSGFLHHYTNLTTDEAATLITSKYLDLDVGSFSRPALSDLNNDGFLDILIGNFRGGLNAYLTDLAPVFSSIETLDIVNQANQNGFVDCPIYPNPVSDRLYITLPQNPSESIAKYVIQIFDVTGKKYDSPNEIFTQNSLALNVEMLVPGMYFLRLQKEDGVSIIQKFVKE